MRTRFPLCFPACFPLSGISGVTPGVISGIILGCMLGFPRPAGAAPDTWIVKQGHDVHGFIKEGPVAAHLALTGLPTPRLLVAFPAGNSTAALWFDSLPYRAVWSPPSTLIPVVRPDSRGRPLNGICTELSLNATSLKVDAALLTSARIVRDYQVRREVDRQLSGEVGDQVNGVSSVTLPAIPDGIVVEPTRDAATLTWQRDRLDGAPGYFLSMTVLNGVVEEKRFIAHDQAPLRFRVIAATGEQALTPLPPFGRVSPVPNNEASVSMSNATMSNATTPDTSDGQSLGALHREVLQERLHVPPQQPHQQPHQARQEARQKALYKALTFLSFQEKTLAGSWRFNTYFGRDTLMTLALLMPALSPEAIEASLSAVLVRVSHMGEVAHEESIGEYAVIERMRKGHASHDMAIDRMPVVDTSFVDPVFIDTPVFDYSMRDTDLMLAPVMAAWLLDTPAARTRAAAFLLAEPANADALIRNLRHVIRMATPLTSLPDGAKHQLATALIGPKPQHETISQWRDSETGLGINGHYAYDVNAVLMPAALEAAARLYESGLLNGTLSSTDHDALGQSRQMAQRWQHDVPPLFDIKMEMPFARAAVEHYAQHINIPLSAAGSAQDAINNTLHFPALSLDAQGRPLPVLHSDIGMLLFFQRPEPAALASFVAAIMRPFPAGLMTDVGMLVANPAFAPERQWPVFDRQHYHGSVVWPWQQALLMAGITKQLARDDLDSAVRAQLSAARRRVLETVQSLPSHIRAKELWSWSYDKDPRDWQHQNQSQTKTQGQAQGSRQGQGRFHAQPYRQFEEANPLQLWNTTLMSPFIPAGVTMHDDA